MGTQSVKQLAGALPGNIRFLARLIARKPSEFSPFWASTVEQAFSLYTKTSSINLILSWRDLLAEGNWPFPAYLDLKKEVEATSCTVNFMWGGPPVQGMPIMWPILPERKPPRVFDGLDVLRLAASVERGSEHPLAAAIVAGAETRGPTLAQVEKFQSFTGRGVVGR